MTSKKLTKIKSKDPDFNSEFQKFQDDLSNIITPITNCPIIYGKTLSNIVFVANKDIVISHGLTTQYQGWFPINQNNFGKFKLSDTVNNMKDKSIILIATNDIVASIYIF